ncbi:hypothetical protein B0H10DRAFT_2184840 [Mycena sp. CBHHK59/15]|nr:hypothetical protein B0H10DRAFT_2184840 [Mycena sp. CBHHK59/15]
MRGWVGAGAGVEVARGRCGVEHRQWGSARVPRAMRRCPRGVPQGAATCVRGDLRVMHRAGGNDMRGELPCVARTRDAQAACVQPGDRRVADRAGVRAMPDMVAIARRWTRLRNAHGVRYARVVHDVYGDVHGSGARRVWCAGGMFSFMLCTQVDVLRTWNILARASSRRKVKGSKAYQFRTSDEEQEVKWPAHRRGGREASREALPENGLMGCGNARYGTLGALIPSQNNLKYMSFFSEDPIRIKQKHDAGYDSHTIVLKNSLK